MRINLSPEHAEEIANKLELYAGDDISEADINFIKQVKNNTPSFYASLVKEKIDKNKELSITSAAYLVVKDNPHLALSENSLRAYYSQLYPSSK